MRWKWTNNELKLSPNTPKIRLLNQKNDQIGFQRDQKRKTCKNWNEFGGKNTKKNIFDTIQGGGGLVHQLRKSYSLTDLGHDESFGATSMDQRAITTETGNLLYNYKTISSI